MENTCFLPIRELRDPVNEIINKTLSRTIPQKTEKRKQTKKKKTIAPLELENANDYSIIEPLSGSNLEKKDYTNNNITINTLVNTPVNNILERREPKNTTDLSNFGFTSILPSNSGDHDVSGSSRPNKTMPLFKNEFGNVKKMVTEFLRERKQFCNLIKIKHKRYKDCDFESTQYSEHSVYSPRENDHDSVSHSPDESIDEKESISDKKDSETCETQNHNKQSSVSTINNLALSFDEKLDMFSSKNLNEITDEEIEFIYQTRKEECVICIDMHEFLDDNVTKRAVKDALKNETHAALLPQSIGLYKKRKKIESKLIEKEEFDFNPWYLLDVYCHLGGYCGTTDPDIIKAANTRILNEIKTQGTQCFYYVNDQSVDMNKTSATMVLKAIEFLDKSSKTSVLTKNNSSQKTTENSDNSLKRLFSNPGQNNQIQPNRPHEKKRKLLGEIKETFYDKK